MWMTVQRLGEWPPVDPSGARRALLAPGLSCSAGQEGVLSAHGSRCACCQRVPH